MNMTWNVSFLGEMAKLLLILMCCVNPSRGHPNFIAGKNCGSVDGPIRVHSAAQVAQMAQQTSDFNYNDFARESGGCHLFRGNAAFRKIADKRPCKKIAR